MHKATLIAALTGLIGFSANADSTLYLLTSTGGNTPFELSQIKEITLPDGQITITLADGTSTTVTDDNFISLSFNATETGHISAICGEDSTGELFDIHGRRISSDAVLPSGVYILKSGQNTRKFLVK